MAKNSKSNEQNTKKAPEVAATSSGKRSEDVAPKEITRRCSLTMRSPPPSDKPLKPPQQENIQAEVEVPVARAPEPEVSSPGTEEVIEKTVARPVSLPVSSPNADDMSPTTDDVVMREGSMSPRSPTPRVVSLRFRIDSDKLVPLGDRFSSEVTLALT